MARYLSLGAFVTFASASTSSVKRTVTSISSPAPYGPLPAGLVVVMFSTRGTTVEITTSRLAPSEQPLKATHVPGSGRLMLEAVAPCVGIINVFFGSIVTAVPIPKVLVWCLSLAAGWLVVG